MEGTESTANAWMFLSHPGGEKMPLSELCPYGLYPALRRRARVHVQMHSLSPGSLAKRPRCSVRR